MNNNYRHIKSDPNWCEHCQEVIHPEYPSAHLDTCLLYEPAEEIVIEPTAHRCFECGGKNSEHHHTCSKAMTEEQEELEWRRYEFGGDYEIEPAWEEAISEENTRFPKCWLIMEEDYDGYYYYIHFSGGDCPLIDKGFIRTLTGNEVVNKHGLVFMGHMFVGLIDFGKLISL